MAKVKGIGLNIKEPLIARLKEFIKKNDELENKLFHKNFTVVSYLFMIITENKIKIYQILTKTQKITIQILTDNLSQQIFITF